MLLAEQSVAVQPDAAGLNTLGIARYRTGDYTGALKTIASSDAVDSVSQDCRIANLAFSSMTQFKLGRKSEAKATFQKLLEAAHDSEEMDDDSKEAFNEAAGLIDPASTQPATEPDTQPTTAP